MQLSNVAMLAMGYSNPYKGLEIIDIRNENEYVEIARYRAIKDSINQTAIRLNRCHVILENTAEKYFPYARLPAYKKRYQSLVLVVRRNNLMTLHAIVREYRNVKELTIK